MTIKQARELGARQLRAAGLPSPQLDVDLLLIKILGVDRVHLLAKDERELSEEQMRQLNEFLDRRVRGEPIAYLIGSKSFYGLDFAVGAGVLVPRPETELLVEQALQALKGIESPRILDIGAGSGAIGLSIAHFSPSATVTLIEASSEALPFLERNRVALARRSGVEVVQCAIEEFAPQHNFDVIVMNPPYIERNDPDIQASVALFEPPQALYSEGLQGTGAITNWLTRSRHWLRPGGMILVEHGHKQGIVLREWLSLQMPELLVEQGLDLAGLERYLKLSLKPKR